MSVLKILLGAVFIFSTGVANASYWCTGPVEGLTISPDGSVWAERVAGFSWQKFCNVSMVDGTTIEACKVVYSTLLTAQISDKSVTLWFNDDGDCSPESRPAWSRLDGWYFGPMINQ